MVGLPVGRDGEKLAKLDGWEIKSSGRPSAAIYSNESETVAIYQNQTIATIKKSGTGVPQINATNATIYLKVEEKLIIVTPLATE